jgi:hypothetical protein
MRYLLSNSNQSFTWQVKAEQKVRGPPDQQAGSASLSGVAFASRRWFSLSRSSLAALMGTRSSISSGYSPLKHALQWPSACVCVRVRVRVCACAVVRVRVVSGQ